MRTYPSYLLWFAVFNLYFVMLAFPSSAKPMFDGKESTTQKNTLSASVDQKSILENSDPLPINDRILSLLSLAKKQSIDNTAKVEDVLLQLEEINSNFNAPSLIIVGFS